MKKLLLLLLCFPLIFSCGENEEDITKQNTSSKVSDVNVKDTITKDTITKDTITKDTIVIVKDPWHGIDISDPENIPDSLWWDYVPEGEE